MKPCSKCEEIKPLLEFNRDKSHADGHMSVCKQCKKQARKKYKRSKTMDDSAYQRKWREAHPDYHREWKEANPGYYEQWRLERPLYFRLALGRRRAIQLGQEPPEPFSEAELRQYWSDHGISAETCYYTGGPLGDPDNWELDHMVPLSRGGRHEMSNLVPCLASVNRDKWDRTADEYAGVREVG